jgi:osmotically-inducible protein OsmY
MTRKLLAIAIAIAAAALPALQGCVPLAVTGVGAAAFVATDRRTTGMYIEDETIEWKVVGRLREAEFKSAHVNSTSFNRRVLLTGEAANEEMKKKIEDAVRSIANVREVTNELQVAGASSLASRGNDALITSNVKARMVNNGKFSPNHVKVVTEASVVYLMGLVSPDEGDAAVEIARTTGGVNRVVKVFEYIGR